MIEGLIEILSKFPRRTAIVGIGNRLRGDDAAGPMVVNALKNRGCENVLDAGSAPENFTREILQMNPEAVIFVDAVEAGREVGQVVFGPVDELEAKARPVSTHSIPLSEIAGYLRWRRPGIKAYLLGIQARSVRFGEQVSTEVRESIEALTAVLSKRLSTRHGE